MDADLKAKWVKALRSGEYRQAQQILRANNGSKQMCCLGVLCNLVDPTKWIEGEFTNRETLEPCRFAYVDDSQTAMPPEMVFRASGLSRAAAIYLAKKNDSGASFHELADYIEQNL